MNNECLLGFENPLFPFAKTNIFITMFFCMVTMVAKPRLKHVISLVGEIPLFCTVLGNSMCLLSIFYLESQSYSIESSKEKDDHFSVILLALIVCLAYPRTLSYVQFKVSVS